MNKILFLCLSLLPVLALAADETLESVLQRHTEAVGGRESIETTKTVRISLKIQEPEFTVDGVYIADRNGRMRIDIYSGDKRVYTEAFDGKNAWEMDGDGKVKDSSEKGTQALAHGVQLPGKLFGLHEMKSRGHQLELQPREIVDGVNYYVVKLTLKDGYAMKYYIDPKTWLIARTRDFRALHVDMDPKEKVIENKLLEYRKVDGVMRSFASEEYDLQAGKKISSGTIKKIERNIALDDSQFNKPDAK